MKPISFKTTKRDGCLITQIVKRVEALAHDFKIDYKAMDCRMDITACHCNGCELDLERLLAADDFNFSHDVFGIRRHIDRSTGQLTGCFVPRMAKPTKAEAKILAYVAK